MVKITEELWNKYDQEIRRTVCNDYCNVKEVDYYIEIMKRIVSKRVSVFDLTLPETTQDGYVECTEYLSSSFLEKHDLTPGQKTIIITNGGKFTSPFGVDFIESGTKGNLKIQPLFLYGEDLCVVLCKINRKPEPSIRGISKVFREGSGECSVQENSKKSPEKKDGSYSIIAVSMILYTSDSAEKAKLIIEDIYSLYKSLPNIPLPPNDTIPVNFVYRTQRGLELFERNVKVSEITLGEFNADLPDEKIQAELRKDGSGLLIFHGEPGCGKSSYIKYLIGTMRDKNFIVVSQDILIGSMEEFRTLLLTKCDDDSIIIIEDCENLVKSREQVGSSVVISDFLNMTDGIYGDLFRIKFILTFNTEIQKIDSALLRKGRLKCKYKFSKLKGEKLMALAKELGIEIKESQLSIGLTLADLYNFDSEVGNSEQQRTKIGFKN